mmetsp:Transcript_88142/g.251597  ORF Transcript_88142/g.251597 Transcript_88142/m.251597 type:complete len:182 (+) Transcript_88142:509-1054(+)
MLRSQAEGGETIAALPARESAVGDVPVANRGHTRDPTISGPIAHIDHLVDPGDVVPLTQEEQNAGQMLLGIFGLGKSDTAAASTAETEAPVEKLLELDEKKEKSEINQQEWNDTRGELLGLSTSKPEDAPPADEPAPTPTPADTPAPAPVHESPPCEEVKVATKPNERPAPPPKGGCCVIA